MSEEKAIPAEDQNVKMSDSDKISKEQVNTANIDTSAQVESDNSSATANVKTRTPKGRKIHVEGAAHVTASFNNTIVTITNMRGDVLSWSSAGNCGFKGSKQGTPYAGQLAAAEAAKKVTDPKTGCGMEKIKIYICGFGPARDSVIRALANHFSVIALIDTTPIPFNGCKQRKERRA